MKNASFRDAEFLERSALDAELTRVFEHCHDCRRCLPLCPSFPSLFEAIDSHELRADRLSAAERREVVDLCYQCQLCYNHCPYHPPHEWAIDFPRLMTRAKLVQAREEGLPLAERIGMQQDAMGKVSCLTQAMTNAAFKNRALRSLMEKVTGIDRRWPMPSYASQPYSKRLEGHRSPTARNGRAVLFTTCFVEYAEHDTADATVAVLEHNGVAVEGGYDRCCGAPFLHGGDLENARRNAEKVVAGLVDPVRQGIPVVVPGPTCSLLLKRDYPELLDSDDARLVAAHTFDVCEFLYRLGREKKLVREFPVALGKVAYHLPCHLKSQNIGFRSQQLLAFAGAEVEMLENCSGVDGTWGMKARFYEQSLKIAEPLVRAVNDLEPDHVASDCPLAAQRIQNETGRRVVHPVSLLRLAYGLPERA
jgi:glycerol-3-phosphate dehydrogenase subunit C